ncbi:hypothetical protein [Methylobacterium aquaticum]|uniref:hypothetical protein n=1 Tax=Methylobacterium aquaticum TaxID=270351 RepID=UPI0019344FA0|nr:hypothetical protein [Methylobacterium aquaticum]QRE77538.1 hypothetical protein F1D61_31980 [Methylobacterium aquaticum]
MSDVERSAIRSVWTLYHPLLWTIFTTIVPASTALAEIADKVEDARAHHVTVSAVLLLFTALAATSGWRRALLLWPLTLVWGMIAFGAVWEWREELQRDGASALLWEGGAMGAAMLLGPPLSAVLAQRWQRRRVRAD